MNTRKLRWRFTLRWLDKHPKEGSAMLWSQCTDLEYERNRRTHGRRWWQSRGLRWLA